MGSVLFVSKSGWVDRDIGSSGGGVNNSDGDDDKVDTISGSSNKTVTSPWVREIEMVEAGGKTYREQHEISQQEYENLSTKMTIDAIITADATGVRKIEYRCLRCGGYFEVKQGSRARYCRGCRKKVAGPGRGKKKVEKTPGVGVSEVA